MKRSTSKQHEVQYDPASQLVGLDIVPVLCPKAGAIRSGPVSAEQGYSREVWQMQRSVKLKTHYAIIRFITYVKTLHAL